MFLILKCNDDIDKFFIFHLFKKWVPQGFKEVSVLNNGERTLQLSN